MLRQLKERLADLESYERRGMAEAPEYPGQMTRAEEIEDLKLRIAAYQRLADLAAD